MTIRPAFRRLLVLGLLALAVWLGFFDSHSVARRVGYWRELDGLREENARLEEENMALAARVRAGLSNETVEKVAREAYGMRRPGETVYRVEPAEAE